MKKMLFAVCIISIIFATTAIAAETYTEKFVQSKTQKIIDTEKNIRAKDAENKARVEAKKKAIEKRQAENKVRVEAKKKAIEKRQAENKVRVETKKKQLDDLLKY